MGILDASCSCWTCGMWPRGMGNADLHHAKRSPLSTAFALWRFHTSRRSEVSRSYHVWDVFNRELNEARSRRVLKRLSNRRLLFRIRRVEPFFIWSLGSHDRQARVHAARLAGLCITRSKRQ